VPQRRAWLTGQSSVSQQMTAPPEPSSLLHQ
jgi:hypothetical protein